MWNEDHTSQLSRIKQRPPTRDFSGGNTSADSLVPRRNSLAVADAVDFSCLDLFSSVVLGSLWSEPGASWAWSGTAELFSLSGGTHQRQKIENNTVHILPGSPICGIEDVAARGLASTRAGFSPSTLLSSRLGPLSTAPPTSTSEWRCEFL